MEKTDKAVSTEDLCTESQTAMCLEAAKLQAVFKTLVENKVEAIKNDKARSSSVHSSPKSLVNRLRITSSSSAASSKDHHHRSYDHFSPSHHRHKRRRKSPDESDPCKDIKRTRKSGKFILHTFLLLIKHKFGTFYHLIFKLFRPFWLENEIFYTFSREHFFKFS